MPLLQSLVTFLTLLGVLLRISWGFASAGWQTPFNNYSKSHMSALSFSKDEKAGHRY